MNTPSATPGWSPDSGVPLPAKLKEDLKLALRTRQARRRNWRATSARCRIAGAMPR